jgi:hypothetical protein
VARKPRGSGTRLGALDAPDPQVVREPYRIGKNATIVTSERADPGSRGRAESGGVLVVVDGAKAPESGARRGVDLGCR